MTIQLPGELCGFSSGRSVENVEDSVLVVDDHISHRESSVKIVLEDPSSMQRPRIGGAEAHISNSRNVPRYLDEKPWSFEPEPSRYRETLAVACVLRHVDRLNSFRE